MHFPAISGILASSGWDSGAPLLPLWVAVPAAVLSLLAVGGHLSALRTAEIPESRRRIRTVNGWLMAALIPVAVYAFSVVTPSERNRFVFVFAVVVALLTIVVVLAGVDAMNNLRLYRSERDELQAEIKQLRSEADRGPKSET